MNCCWRSVQHFIYGGYKHQINATVGYKTSSMMFELLDQLSTVANVNSDKNSADKLINVVQNLQKKTGNQGYLKSPDWQRRTASLVYELNKSKNYQELDLLVNEMKNHNYIFPDGIQNTLFQSYVDRKLWEDAVSLLKNPLKTSKVKHLRWYHYLIDGLAKDGGKLNEAHFYFKGLIRLEQSAMFKRNVKAKQNTITALLQAFVDVNNRSTFRDGRNLLENVLDYMQLNDLVVTDQNVDIFSKAFEKANHTVVIGNLKDYRCSSCSKIIVPQQSFQNIGNLISTSIRSHLINSGRYTVMQHIDKYFENGKAYHFVIDLANVLCYGSKGGVKDITNHSFKRIENVLKSITNIDSDSCQRIILIMPPSGIEKLRPLKRTIQKVLGESYMKVHIDTITTKKIEDDYLLLYIASKSEALLRQSSNIPVCIISNDTFANYTYSLLPSCNQMGMLQWLRHKVKHFNFNGTVDFTPYVANVSYNDEDIGIHVRSEVESGKMLCIRKKKEMNVSN